MEEERGRRRASSVLAGLASGFNKSRTIRSKAKFDRGSARWSLHKALKASLGKGDNLKAAVRVPAGESRDQWLYVHAVDMRNSLAVIYGTVTSVCTPEMCPVMSAGPRFDYLWADGIKYPSPTPLPAPEYVECLMDWMEEFVVSGQTSLKLFPADVDAFGEDGLTVLRSAFRRMTRVFAHIYYCHFESIQKLKLDGHLNDTFHHFYLFSREHQLVDVKELEPLIPLLKAMGWWE